MTETPARAAISFKRIIGYTLDPLQFSFRRNVSKNELPARCSRRMDCRLFLIATTSPASNGVVICPSPVRITSTFWLRTFTRTTECRLTITERFESVWGQIGVRVKTSAEGWTTDPPAASEYAVEPVGEQTIKPSQR